MVGNKWLPAQGTIMNSQLDYTRPQGKGGAPQYLAYDVNARMPDGSVRRVQVASGHHRSLQPGQIVRLEVHAKTGEIRLHPSASQLEIGFDPSAAASQVQSAAGGGIPGASTVTTTFGMGGGGMDVTQFLGDSFTDRVSMVAGPEAMGLVRAMMSGDAGARAAARDQLMQLARNQSQVYQGQMQAPGPIHNPAERVARLQEMVDRGQISQEEFEAKRRQILDQI